MATPHVAGVRGDADAAGHHESGRDRSGDEAVRPRPRPRRRRQRVRRRADSAARRRCAASGWPGDARARMPLTVTAVTPIGRSTHAPAMLPPISASLPVPSLPPLAQPAAARPRRSRGTLDRTAQLNFHGRRQLRGVARQRRRRRSSAAAASCCFRTASTSKSTAGRLRRGRASASSSVRQRSAVARSACRSRSRCAASRSPAAGAIGARLRTFVAVRRRRLQPRTAIRRLSDFAGPGENVDERFNGFHVLGGAEYLPLRWLAHRRRSRVVVGARRDRRRAACPRRSTRPISAAPRSA